MCRVGLKVVVCSDYGGERNETRYSHWPRKCEKMMAVGLQMGNERSRSEHRHEKSMKSKSTSKSFRIDVSTTTCDDQVEDSQVERRRVAVSAWLVPVRALKITLRFT